MGEADNSVAMAKQAIESMTAYIDQSSEIAAKVYADCGFQFSLFDDKSLLTLTPAMCREIYCEIIMEMFVKKVAINKKFGLIVAIIPAKTEEGLEFSIDLGMIFPAKKSS